MKKLDDWTWRNEVDEKNWFFLMTANFSAKYFSLTRLFVIIARNEPTIYVVQESP